MVLAQLPEYVRDGTALFGLIVTVLTAGILLRKSIFKPVAAAVKTQLREVIQETVGPDIQAIRYEVTLNGGGTLKDGLVSINAKVHSIESRLSRMESYQPPRVKPVKAQRK